MLVSRRSLFELYLRENQIVTQENTPFDAAFYSRFKYGSGLAAAHYAKLLCEILGDVWQPSQHWIVTSSAYKCVPTASDAIAQAALKIMQQLVHFQEIASINSVKIHRNILFDSDYGNLPYEQRLQLMQQTPLEIEAAKVRGKHLLIIDDLRVTGAHEQKVHDLLQRTEAEQLLFVYVAEWKQCVEPTIEHRLNHEWVKSLNELHYIIENEDFMINARVCKFLLSYPHPPDLAAFYAKLSPDLLQRLHEAICGDGYHLMPNYKACYEILKQSI